MNRPELIRVEKSNFEQYGVYEKVNPKQVVFHLPDVVISTTNIPKFCDGIRTVEYSNESKVFGRNIPITFPNYHAFFLREMSETELKKVRVLQMSSLKHAASRECPICNNVHYTYDRTLFMGGSAYHKKCLPKLLELVEEEFERHSHQILADEFR